MLPIHRTSIAAAALLLWSCNRSTPTPKTESTPSTPAAQAPSSAFAAASGGVEAKTPAAGTTTAAAKTSEPSPAAGSGGGDPSGGSGSEATTTSAGSETGDAPPPALSVDEILIVARKDGLVALDFEGTLLRKLSKTPGRSPRWLNKRKGLVFLRQRDGRSTALERVELPGGKQRRVAKLPLSAPCPDASYADPDEPDWIDIPQLDLQNEDELWVTRDGKHVCFVASDHPADLRDNQREIAIRLATGHVDQALTFGGEQCSAPTADKGPAPCANPPPPPDIDDEPKESAVGGFIRSASPDGHWQLVQLASVLGDVVHTQYVLYHPKSGKAYPLVQDGTTAWPKPFRVPTIEDPEEMISGLPEVEGGAVIQWVSDHHLVVGQTLFIAGERIVPLEGDLAI